MTAARPTPIAYDFCLTHRIRFVAGMSYTRLCVKSREALRVEKHVVASMKSDNVNNTTTASPANNDAVPECTQPNHRIVPLEIFGDRSLATWHPAPPSQATLCLHPCAPSPLPAAGSLTPSLPLLAALCVRRCVPIDINLRAQGQRPATLVSLTKNVRRPPG